MRRFLTLSGVMFALIALAAAMRATGDTIDPVSNTLPSPVQAKYRALFPGHKIWQVSQTGKGKDARYELTVFDPNATGTRGIQVGQAHVTTLINYKLVLTATGEVIREQAHPIAEDAVPMAVKKAAAAWIGPRLSRPAAGSHFVEWLAHQEEGGQRLYSVQFILSAVEGYTATLKADGTFVKKSTEVDKEGGTTDPRVLAFVAYLKRNGIELVPHEERQRWRIVTPGHSVILTTKIHPFPPLVSKAWMENWLKDSSWSAELNPAARLVVSSVSVADRKTKLPDKLKDIPGKVRDLFRRYKSPPDVIASDKRAAKDKQALLEFLKKKGIELRSVESTGGYIQHRYSVGPDHNKKMLVGLNYLSTKTAKERLEERDYSIPSVAHGSWALFRLGGPGGNATKEYTALWKKVEAAFKAYPGDQ